MLKFNLSPSSLNCYLNSPLEFYYSYIEKRKPDTVVPQCYGKAGSLVHECLEKYPSELKKHEDVYQFFEYEWHKQKLHEMTGLYSKKLDKIKYVGAVTRGLQLLDTTYTNERRPEEKIEFPYIKNDNYQINIKGIIDLPCKNEKGEWVISDWKTSSSVDTGLAFKRQGLFYALLYYLKYNIIVSEVTFEYIKIGKSKTYVFTKEELLEFHEYIKSIIQEIVSKKSQKSKFDVGNFDTPFNGYKNSCIEEFHLRRGMMLDCVIEKNKLKFISKLPKLLVDIMDEKYSYFVDGYAFSEKYKQRLWDGKKHLYKRDTIPLTFLTDFKLLLEFYNKKLDTNYQLSILDLRNKEILKKKNEAKPLKSKYKLRDYQGEAVSAALEKKIGIIAIGTGGGKTLISSRLIRKISKKTLFIVNRIELLNQTKENFEEMLQVPIGSISEGEMHLEDINVASIQSLVSILARRDATSKQLALLMYNTPCVIFDECQNVSNSKMYEAITKYLPNLEYSIGLSGSPWRNDGATLEMNSLVGFPIYTKTTKELEQMGYLVPTKCIFVHHATVNTMDNEYAEQYRHCILKSERRNNKIKKVVDAFRKKGKKILIITKLVDHAKTLKEEFINNSEVITGTTNKKARKKIFEDFKNNKDKVLIGSIKIFSAGIDIPDLDVIINATAHKSSVDSIQIVGRVKRKYEGKKMSYFVDFADSASFFKKSYLLRKKILKEFGNKIIDQVDVDQIETCINENIYI